MTDKTCQSANTWGINSGFYIEYIKSSQHIANSFETLGLSVDGQEKKKRSV